MSTVTRVRWLVLELRGDCVLHATWSEYRRVALRFEDLVIYSLVSFRKALRGDWVL